MLKQGQIIFQEQPKRSKVPTDTLKRPSRWSILSSIPSLPAKPPPDEDMKVQEEGVKEAVKEEIKQELQNKQRFEDLVKKAGQVLMKLSAVWPFDFFPDEIIIDEYKVSIVSKVFFWSEQVHSIMIKDISDVMIETGPFFASLVFVGQSFIENEIRVSFLKKSEATKARRIIQGLMVAAKGSPSEIMGGLDVSVSGQSELIDKLEQLGKSRSRQ